MHEPITEAAYNTAKISAAKFWLVQLFGQQAERLVDRMASQQQES